MEQKWNPKFDMGATYLRNGITYEVVGIRLSQEGYDYEVKSQSMENFDTFVISEEDLEEWEDDVQWEEEELDKPLHVNIEDYGDGFDISIDSDDVFPVFLSLEEATELANDIQAHVVAALAQKITNERKG